MISLRSTKKILITGSSGFLGRKLKQELVEHGHEVVAPSSMELNLIDSNSLLHMEHDYNVIFHLATWTRAGAFCREKSGEQWLVNEKINLNILDFWSRCNDECHLISFGTSVAYSDGLDMKGERSYLMGDPISDYYGYSTTKRSLLYGQICINKQYNKPFSHFIPSTIYGPEYHVDGRDLHFIYDIARKIIKYKYFSDDIVLWGDGYQSRELVFIDDVISVLIAAIENPMNSFVNIGSGNSITIRDAARTICKILDVDYSMIEYNKNAFVGVKAKVLETNKLDRLFPNRHKTNFHDGIEATISWLEPLVKDGEI